MLIDVLVDNVPHVYFTPLELISAAYCSVHSHIDTALDYLFSGILLEASLGLYITLVIPVILEHEDILVQETLELRDPERVLLSVHSELRYQAF